MSAPIVAIGPATTVSTVEIVLATSPTLSTAPVGGLGFALWGTINTTPNATPGTITIRVRQNSLTGTAVYTSSALIPVASVAQVFAFTGLDTAVAAAGGVSNYVLTVTFTNAPTLTTGNLFIQEAEDND